MWGGETQRLRHTREFHAVLLGLHGKALIVLVTASQSRNLGSVLRPSVTETTNDNSS